jgi:hypothetical protein
MGTWVIHKTDVSLTTQWILPPGADGFTRADFVSLATRLRQTSGRFIQSVNDVPETREIFRRFAIETVATRYTVSRQMVRCDRDRRHRPIVGARLARPAVVFRGGKLASIEGILRSASPGYQPGDQL